MGLYRIPSRIEVRPDSDDPDFGPHGRKENGSYKGTRPNRRRWWLIVPGTVVILLVAGRLALPSILKSYVNRRLNNHPVYSGQVGDIQVQLVRGAYTIKDISIFKRSGAVKAPLFAASELDLSVQWKELFHGAAVGEVSVRSPQMNFVSGPTEEQSQTGKEKAWDETLESLFPFRLNRVEITNGQVHFRNPYSDPPVDIFVNQLGATATNLTNSRDLGEALWAGARAQGTTVGGGRVDLQLRLNPLEHQPTFEVNCTVTNVDLVALNDFLRAYGRFDVQRGVFHLYTSVASKEGSYEGYLKVLFEDLDVLNWKEDQKESALGVFWEAIVGTLTSVFKNQPKDRLATKIPIAGSYSGTEVGVWTAVSALLQNAFVRALVPKLDSQMTVNDVLKESDTKSEREDGEDQTDGEEKAGEKGRGEKTRDDDANRERPPHPTNEKGAEKLNKASQSEMRKSEQ